MAKQTTGYAVLHELFHLDSLSKVATTGHVYDLQIQYKGNGPTYGKANVYGPFFTKILAQWGGADVGKYIATNGK